MVQKALKKTATKTLLPRVIAISSGKGGVGKSSIAVNLGISLAKNGEKVCLLDADTGLANVNILLGLTPQFSLEHVLYGAKSIEEVMLDGPHGMKIVPGANGISDCVNLHPRQQLRLTRELARIETEFDFLLVDTAAGITETTLDFVSAAHHAMVVITPDPTSLTDAFSLIKLLKRRRSTVHYHIVVNMCSSAGQAKEVYHRFCAAVEKYIGVQNHYLGYILRDESMRAAVVLQNPVAMFPDTDPSCRSFLRLADALDSATSAIPVSSSFSAYWHRQYREQRGGARDKDDEQHEESVVSPVPSTAATQDSDYLSELRSRVLLLIEQGNADESLLCELLQEGAQAFIKRYDALPVDALEIVDHLVQSPERDDQLLRQIADRVKPWGSWVSVPTVEELLHGEPSKEGRDEDVASDPAGGPEPEPGPQSSTLSVNPNPLDWVDPLDGAAAVEPELPAAVETSLVNDIRLHQYDRERFGSQEHLLDLIQRQRNGANTLSALLDVLL